MLHNNLFISLVPVDLCGPVFSKSVKIMTQQTKTTLSLMEAACKEISQALLIEMFSFFKSQILTQFVV